jgi:hypothetical protein
VSSRALNDLRLARLKLRVDIPEQLPAIVQDLLEACVLIVTERERFPELGSGRGQARFGFSDSMRERDLRRLETIALAAMSLILHMDLVTMRNGAPRRDNSCNSLRVARPRARKGRTLIPRGSWRTMEDETGRSRSALFEALRDGRDAGYWESHQPKKSWEDDQGDEHWRSFPAVYVLKKAFIERLLGKDRMADFEAQRQLASQRQREHYDPPPIVDIRLRRARQRVIRAQALAAKRASFRPSEAEARRALQLLEERVRTRPLK